MNLMLTKIEETVLLCRITGAKSIEEYPVNISLSDVDFIISGWHSDFEIVSYVLVKP